MTTDWARLVRSVVHGDYFLKSFDGERQGAGLFRASDAAGGEVDVYLLPAEATQADAFDLHWSATASFSHPALVQTLAFGPVRIDGEEFLCAVSEKPDDRLSDLVSVRSLTPEEAREVLESTVAALEYLHDHKYLHGDYGVHSIVACDGRTKLTTATIRPFVRSLPEDRSAFMQEIKAVGDTTLTMLLGPAESALPPTVPPELAMIVRTASRGDELWSPTAVDLLHALKGVQIEPEDATPSTAAPDKSLDLEDEQEAIERPAPAGAKRAEVVALPRKARPYEAVVLATVALVAVIAATIYFAWPERRPAETVEASPNRPVYGATASTPKAAPVSAAPKVTRAEPQERTRRAGEWAVVAATYNDRRAATRRAEQLARKWAAVKPQVVPPVEGAKRYLIVLGSGLSHAEANRLRQRAASSGMPRDSYITKLSW